jgi:hypothetical protein
MKDYLMIIKTQGSVFTDLSPEKLKEHLELGQVYLGNLMSEGKLKAGNPVDKGGRIVSDMNGEIKDSVIEGNELAAGYLLVAAKDMDEAIEITKGNPIFHDIPTKIEVYPLMPIQRA